MLLSSNSVVLVGVLSESAGLSSDLTPSHVCLFFFCPFHDDKVSHVNASGSSCGFVSIGKLSCCSVISPITHCQE